MEYLMTYGWAILVIAVILGVLFQLGVFGSANLAPKAKAGQCQVQVVGGGSSSTHQLAGLCSPELPQYVAVFNGQSNGAEISTPIYFPSGTAESNFTLSAWIYPTSSQDQPGGIVDSDNGINGWGLYYFYGSPGYADFWILGQGYSQDMGFGSIPSNQWTFVAITYYKSGGNYYASGYVNGNSVDSNVQRGAIVLPIPPSYTLQIGDIRYGCCYYFGGNIANVQLYNATLSQAEMTALYDEGIGGAPVRPQNVTGWWPLNGNANDYSGNNYNGQNNGAGYSSFWDTGYTAP